MGGERVEQEGAGQAPPGEAFRAPAALTLQRLQRLGLLLILAVAMVPRLRDVAAPFDREVEGAQGAFFAIAAVNYERLGLTSAGGYPVLNVDAMEEAAPGVLLPLERSRWLIYANHPPTVPLLAWMALDAMGPDGWDQAWKQDRAPEGVELPIRIPFALFHLLFLLTLWWAVRESHGERAALIALGLAAAVPVLTLYATLVNYENPALLCIALAAGCHARWLRNGLRDDLWMFALACLLGSCVTYAGAFFLPFFVLAAFATGRFFRGLSEALIGGTATLLPLVAHGLWNSAVARDTGRELPGPADRALEILNPLFDGSLPIGRWLTLQLARMGTWITWPVAALALVGLAILFVRMTRPQPPEALRPDWEPVDVGTPLFLGGWLYLLAFYRHSYDPQHSFLMLVAPGFVVLAAVALDALPYHRLKAGIAPIVVVVSSVALVGLRESNALRHRYRATAEQAARHDQPPPAFPLPSETGASLAQLVQPGALGLYPADTGLNLAVHFYAWRSLAPIQAADDEQYRAIARSVGLSEAPRILLLPDPPPREAEDQTLTLRAALVPPEASLRRADGWLAAPLP